jgi:hypothetical protein
MRVAATCLLLIVSCAVSHAATCAVPGAINQAVTQDNIKDTICKPGWTATVRPPEEYTEALKRRLIQQRNPSASAQSINATMKSTELDHCIPLELGGNPRSEKNLWLQPWNGSCGAHAKDKLENSLRRDVCAGRKTLAQARVAVMQWCL